MRSLRVALMFVVSLVAAAPALAEIEYWACAYPYHVSGELPEKTREAYGFAVVSDTEPPAPTPYHRQIREREMIKKISALVVDQCERRSVGTKCGSVTVQGSGPGWSNPCYGLAKMYLERIERGNRSVVHVCEGGATMGEVEEIIEWRSREAWGEPDYVHYRPLEYLAKGCLGR